MIPHRVYVPVLLTNEGNDYSPVWVLSLGMSTDLFILQKGKVDKPSLIGIHRCKDNLALLSYCSIGG